MNLRNEKNGLRNKEIQRIIDTNVKEAKDKWDVWINRISSQ